MTTGASASALTSIPSATVPSQTFRLWRTPCWECRKPGPPLTKTLRPLVRQLLVPTCVIFADSVCFILTFDCLPIDLKSAHFHCCIFRYVLQQLHQLFPATSSVTHYSNYNSNHVTFWVCYSHCIASSNFTTHNWFAIKARCHRSTLFLQRSFLNTTVLCFFFFFK